MNTVRKIVIILAVAMLILTMAVATASAASIVKDEKKNKGIVIESKEKKIISYKVTWNCNGGKIGTQKTKVTNVKKGSKIGKLVATPKRSGFSFKGWFTKKTGGKKINKDTKVTKSVTLYAHWKKGNSRVLTSEEKKLVGIWGNKWDGSVRFRFYADGTFIGLTKFESYHLGKNGTYSLKNGVLTMKYNYSRNYARPFGNNYGKGWGSWKYETAQYEGDRGVKFSTIDGKSAFTYGLYRMNGEWFLKDRTPPFTLEGFPKDYF